MADVPHESLGEKIRATRMAQGMKLRELARRVGLTPSYISDIENDRRVPSEDVLRQIAQELGLNIERVMELAGRFGSDAERYIRRTPATTTLFRRLQERNLSDEEVRRLIEDIDRLRAEESSEPGT